MITHPLLLDDLEAVRAIHEKFFKDDFPFPDFARNWLITFKILSESGEIITAGGVKLNPELVLITDKTKSQSERMFALVSALQIGLLHSKISGHELLTTVAIEDNFWIKMLRSYGFRDSIGTHLVIG